MRLQKEQNRNSSQVVVDLKEQLRLRVIDESFKELFKYKEE